MNKKMLLAISLLLNFAIGYGQCAYPGTPLVQVGSDYTFCIDNSNTFTTATVNSGRYVIVNVVKGFTYTFSVGNVFTADNENLTIFNITNVFQSGGTASGATGATISNWISPLSGKIKVLLSRGNCSNNNDTGGALTLTLNSVGNTQDSQTAFGTDQWVGHVYNWTGTTPPGGTSPTTPSTATTPFINANYVGYYNIANETINEGFGGNTVCFPVLSDGVNLTNIYTETFAVRYRMRSTKRGCYLLSVNGDDGVRVYVDNVLVFDAWKEQGNTTYCNNLIYLNGGSDIIFDYYENGGLNVVGFSLTEFVPTTNTIAGAAIRNVCSGVSPGLLDGSAYLPCTTSSISNVKFQWQVSTDNVTFTDISGATSEDYTPAAITTGTNVVRYYSRVLKASASNAGSCKFNTNVITVNTSASAVLGTVGAISGATTQCFSLIGQVYSVTAVTNALNYAWTVPTGWTITDGQGTNSITVTTGTSGQNGNISVRASNGCTTSAVKSLAVTVGTASVGGSISGGTTICSGATSGLLTLSGHTGTILRWESAVSPFSTWTTIANTTTTYTSGAITQSTQFRAVVQSGSCAIANSSSVFIQLYDAVGNNNVSYTNGTSGQVNGTAAENASVVLTAPAGTYFTQVNFASYGTSTGTSPNFVINSSCHAANSQSVSETYLLGNTGSITIPATNTVFGDPCSGTVKKLSVLASYAQSICSATSVTITGTTPTGGTGTYVYLWESSTSSATAGFAPAAGTNNGINYTTAALTQTTWFRRIVTSCSVSSPSSVVMVIVNPNLPASVSIVASTTIICAGTNVTFTATPTNGGTTPSYQWKVNGVNAGTNNATFSSTSLINGDTVTVILTSNATPCLTGSPVTSNAIVLTVNQLPTTPTFSKTDIDCINATGSITVTVQNVGETYSFDNGATFQSGNSKSGLVAGAYNVVIKSAAGCLSPATAPVAIADKSSTTWNGSAWSNDQPSSTKKIIFDGDYTFGINLPASDLAGCSCEVLSGIIRVPDGFTLTLTNELKVTGGTLTFDNNASLVQVNDNAINTGKIYYKRHTTAVRRYDFTYWSSPVTPQTLYDLSPNTLSDKYFGFNSGINDFIPYNGGAYPMKAGLGYLIRAPQSFSITTATIDTAPVFVGQPNNGLIQIPLIKVDQLYLLGNPYPSALDADKFLQINNAGSTPVLDGTLYFWTHNSEPSNAVVGDATYNYTSDDYASYNNVGGVGTAIRIGNTVGTAENSGNKPSGKIAAGQGFFVYGATGGTAIFNNNMRVAGTSGNNSQFFRTKNPKAKVASTIEKNRVWLNLTNTQGAFKQILVGYVTGATNEYDPSYDGYNFSLNKFIDFYSLLGTDAMAIQGRALPFNDSDIVPIGYSSTIAGDFSISIDELDGTMQAQNIFLEDKLLSSIHNLKVSPYTFNTAAGTFDDRFVLRYTDRTLGNVDFEKTNNQVSISKDKNELKIKSEIEIIKQVTVFDLLGKKVFEKTTINSNEFRSSTIGFNQQIGIVKVTLANGQVISKKVIF